MRLSRRWWVVVALVGVVLALRLLVRFPWSATGAALMNMRMLPLGAALLVNLCSPVAKGWAWRLLLKPLAPTRWRTVQKANLVGTAVNSVTVGVSGEVARVSLLARWDRVSIRAATLSVAWTRMVEGIGLALFIVIAPIAFRLPRTLRGLQLGAAIALLTVVALSRLPRWTRLIARLPHSLRASAIQLARMSLGTRLVLPTLLALVNWIVQWATYDLVLRAAGLGLRPAASLTALLAVNLGSLGRLTPGNLGVTQAAMVGALLPFGVSADRAVAAGFALQAIQVLPILGIAGALVGWSGLKSAAHASDSQAEEGVASGEAQHIA